MEVDEGIEEDVGDPTIFKPDPPPTTSTVAAAQSADPAEAPKSEPSTPAAPHQHAPPEAPEVQAPAPQHSSDSKDEVHGPEGQPGYQRFCRRQKSCERAVQEQGLGMVPAPAAADQPLPAAKGLSLEQVGQGQPFTSGIPEEQPGPSSRGLPPPPDQPRPVTVILLSLLRPLLPTSGSAAPPAPLLGPPGVPCTTAYRKRKVVEASPAAAAGQGPPQGQKARWLYACSKCGQPRRLDTGHTRIAGVSYCAAVGGKTVEEWKEDMKRCDPPKP
ncbi:predicted GPI-anchored protein 58 [Archocentrus centrarchus]|uniref:predicted GPI-anchored protein 58 n=1 Tax=Archocentrus centrarchus TaxID=63155 RepID=UPI0011E9DCD5|nr:predicted GPI-anchored protein 58 [Archocentrus centrarchus]